MVFDLQHQWPVRRKRFWCHMVAPRSQLVPIPSWPTTLEYQKLQDIMPLNAMWHPLDEQHLDWDESELSIYLDPTYGSDQRILQAGDKAPTALYSWGHVSRSCPAVVVGLSVTSACGEGEHVDLDFS